MSHRSVGAAGRDVDKRIGGVGAGIWVNVNRSNDIGV